MSKKLTGNQIRQDFIDFFVEHGHTAVPSMSLVPGGDSTLLFTNSGMVQFKDVFIGTDKKPYTRAVDSQKCMRVAGKHNDLEDVGRDDTHHTFFEMLGNWSFGDYYKEEAIAWSWQLLTEVWGLPKDKLYATCFRDDKGNVPQDDEAADIWRTAGPALSTSTSMKLACGLRMKYSSAMLRPPETATLLSAMNSLLCMRWLMRLKSSSEPRMRQVGEPERSANGLKTRTCTVG